MYENIISQHKIFKQKFTSDLGQVYAQMKNFSSDVDIRNLKRRTLQGVMASEWEDIRITNEERFRAMTRTYSLKSSLGRLKR